MKWCFEGSALKKTISPLFLKSDHNEISMANANINALYVGSLRIQISHFFSE